MGAYLFSVPPNCTLSTQSETIVNENQANIQQRTILFPNLGQPVNQSSKIDLTVQLEDIKLDELQKLKIQIMENQPSITYNKIHHFPSIWTIIIYVLLALIIGYFCFKKLQDTGCLKRTPQQEERRIEDVQLHRFPQG